MCFGWLLMLLVVAAVAAAVASLELRLSLVPCVLSARGIGILTGNEVVTVTV